MFCLGGLASWPLKRAVRREVCSIARLLLDAGADPNLRGSDGWSAPMVALADGSLSSLALLLDAGAVISPGDIRACREAASTKYDSTSDSMHWRLLALHAMERVTSAHGQKSSRIRYNHRTLLNSLCFACRTPRAAFNNEAREHASEGAGAKSSQTHMLGLEGQATSSDHPLVDVVAIDPTYRIVHMLRFRAAAERSREKGQW